MNQPKGKPHRSNSPTGFSNKSFTPPQKGQYFEIRIKGQLSDVWADWFDGLTIEYLDNEEMLLSGYVVDQSALMGILNKLARLNLTIKSLSEINNKKEKK